MTIEKLIEHLKKNYGLKDNIAYDIWTEDDVNEQAENMNIELTDDEIVKVLDMVNSSKDANVGINWDVIDSTINDFVIERQKFRNIIIYGGTKRQIIKQQLCNHEWSEVCIDNRSRYNKCKKCFCIRRDMTEQEYYNDIGLDINSL